MSVFSLKPFRQIEMRFEMDKSQLHNQTQHILSAAEGGVGVASAHATRYAKNSGGGGDGALPLTHADRECRVSLEERELWSKFQELTNEMIVTKNGR